MSTQKLYCFSERNFNNEMRGNNWIDNVPNNVAVISILYVYNEGDHWFNNSENIINLDFDDLTPDGVVAETLFDEITDDFVCKVDKDDPSKWFYPLNHEQARLLVDFIDKNIDKDFYIHCNAGESRSQGVVRYILDTYPERNWELNKNNPCDTPNWHVVNLLKRTKNNYE